MTNKEYHNYVLIECERQWNENQAKIYGKWHLQSDDTKAEYYNQIYSDCADLLTKNCIDCAYCGDKYSFPIPNNLVDVDNKNPFIKHYYCCCGDTIYYKKDITGLKINNCSCFEEI